MNRITRSLTVLAFGAILLIVGCEPQNSPAPPTDDSKAANPAAGSSTTSSPVTLPVSGDYRIVILTNVSAPFWDAADRGSQEAATKLGVKVEFLRNSEATEAGQVQRLEQLAGQNDVKGVAISLIDAQAAGVIDQMIALRKKGVHVITIDADGPAESRAAFIGTNNSEAGRELGKATAALRPDGGSSVCFVGYKGSQNARERIQGFQEGAGEKIKLVDTMEDQTDPAKARNNVTAAMQNHPELNILAGIWSYNATAISDIVESSGRRKDLSVVVFDADPNAIVAMEQGLIDVMLVQNPFEMGYQGVVLLNAMIKRDDGTVKQMLKGSDVYDTGFKVVVPDEKSPIQSPARTTFSEFKAWLAEKKLSGS